MNLKNQREIADTKGADIKGSDPFMPHFKEAMFTTKSRRREKDKSSYLAPRTWQLGLRSILRDFVASRFKNFLSMEQGGWNKRVIANESPFHQRMPIRIHPARQRSDQPRACDVYLPGHVDAA